MLRKQLLTLTALTLGASLAGCAGLPTDALDGLTSRLNAQQSTALKAMVNDAVAAVQTESDMDVSSVFADESNFKVQSLAFETAATAKASASIGFKHRMDKFKDRAKSRITERKGAVKDYVRTVSQPDASGSYTVTVTMQMSNRGGAQSHTTVKTYAAGDLLTEATSHLERTGKNGIKMVVDRKRSLNADGTWTITYDGTFTRKDGKVKTVAWTRTEGENGIASGNGTITRFDGSVVTVTITKDAEGTTVTKTSDTQAKVDAAITQNDASAGATVTATDTTSGTVAGQTTIADTETVEPSDK